MKKTIITLISAAIALAATSFSTINAKDTNPLRDGIEKFKSISVSANVNIKLVEDSCYNVMVLCPDSVLRKAIDYKVDNDGVLKIFNGPNDKTTRPVNVVISGPRTSLEVKVENGYVVE